MITDKGDLDEYLTTGEITASLLSDAVHFQVQTHLGKRVWYDQPILKRVWESNVRLCESVARFEKEVWLAGLALDYFASIPQKPEGRETIFGPFQLRMILHLGRVLLTFSMDSGRHVTLITTDPQAPLGIQGIWATEGQAVFMFERAIRHWHAGGLGLHPNASLVAVGLS